MKLTSPAFKHNEMIPQKYTHDGDDINPALHFENIPEHAKSLALIVDDPDAPGKTWVHWVVYDIPVTSEIDENSIPGKQGTNDFNRKGYGGPAPPSGMHHYYFNAFALDEELNLEEGIRKGDLEKAMEGKVISHSQLVGVYGH